MRLALAPPFLLLLGLAAAAGVEREPTGARPELERAPLLELRARDRVCLIGNALAERLQHSGWLETRLQERFPALELSFRNLGFGGDELEIRQRTAGFGSPDEHLARCRASVVLAFFGHNESFGGAAALPAFRRDLAAFVEHTRGQRYDGEAPSRLVLFSPIGYEDLGDERLPDPVAENERIAAYTRAMAEVAEEKGVAFVDLQARMRAPLAGPEPLTTNGLHLVEAGQRVLSRVIEEALFGPREAPVDEARRARLRDAVRAKNLLWFNRYRPTDGYNVYGGRSSLSYDGVTNFEVLQRELEALDAMVANGDARVQAIASGRDASPEPVPVPSLIPVETNRPGEGPGGAHVFLSGEEAIERMTPMDGAVVELFADEQRFPELANPVQMAFDARGRLWVAVWPTYPHWRPDEEMRDGLVILEDVDGDGRADTLQSFVGDLHNPTGFEFWNGGVLVGCAPDLLFLRDTDGDDRADERERLLHGISSADTHHSLNSFVIGPEGALYFQEGTFHRSQLETVRGPVRNEGGCVWRFHPRTWRVERYVAYGFANPHGHVFDRWGQDFVTDGTGNVNYWAAPFSGWLPSPERHAAYFPFFPQRSRPSAATEILSSASFPEGSQGNYLIANVIGFQGIFQYEVGGDGAGFAAEETTPLVHGADPNFRPVDIEVGPDGAVYFLDWHNPLIGHMQHHLRDPSRDRTHGRIYRVRHTGAAPRAPRTVAGRTTGELLDLLTSREDRVRYAARLELGARDADEVVSAVRRWASALDPADPEREHHLLEALWVQAHHDVLDAPLLDRVLAAEDFRARAAATRHVRHLRHRFESPEEALARLARSAADEHPRVRLEAVVACSFFARAGAAEVALGALARPTDRFLDYALRETLRALEPHWRGALATGAPFCASNPEGLGWALERLDTSELLGVAPGHERWVEVLRRHDVERAEHLAAAEALARASGTDATEELLDAVDRADARDDAHADHLIGRLFDALRARVDSTSGARLDALADDGRHLATRRLATAARLDRGAGFAAAWRAADDAARLDLAQAAPFVEREAARDAAFEALLALLDAEPSARDAELRGRYVRIELPGDARTLTLAEVEVFSDGTNVARRGAATQSTVAWGGVAARGIDGLTSGAFGDGGQTHTVEDQPSPWWEVDLGAELPLERVVVWNRTEAGGRWLSRLDDFVLRVLSADRRTVFHARRERAPNPSLAIELASDAARLRRVAVETLPRLGVHEGRAALELVRRFDDARLRPAIARALAATPIERWTDATRDELARRLTGALEATPAEAFALDAGRDLLALADELVRHLSADAARALFELRAPLGPQVVELRPIPDRMLFDRESFTVAAGRPVELRFENVDLMPHNVLVTAPGALAKVGRAGEAMAAEPDAWLRGFVPDLPEVLASSRLLQPGESQVVAFDAPEEPGDYPFVCTFPGHWIRMNGTMHVVPPEEALARLAADRATEEEAPADAAPGRAFVRAWTVADLEPHWKARLAAGASPDEARLDRGRAVLEAASCLQCHRVRDADDGARTGPPLAEVAGRYAGLELLRQVLEPSLRIAEGYEAEVFVTKKGRIVAGRVLEETDALVRVQDDPYLEKTLDLPVAELAERYPSPLSTMPEGLLSTFERAEVLDLVAYLESLRGQDAPR